MTELSEIKQGLERGEFFIEYSPIVSIEDERCVGAEALARWNRPSGIVYPNSFIPTVENSIYSGTFTYWVIDTVAEELSSWLQAYPDVYISINVPPEILGRGGLEYAAKKAGLLEFSRQIVLEITERSVPDLLGVQSLTYGIEEAGVRYALDDFTMSGTNLAILTRCPFEIVKIDSSLVGQIVSGSPLPEWLRGLSALLREVRIEVIAEGAETTYQITALREAGVRLFQGFYFARPTTASGLREFHAQLSIPG